MNHRTALGALHIGALFFGLTGVFGKLAASASPSIIVFGRATFAVLALGLFIALARQRWQPLHGHVRRLLLGGVLLAGHWVSFFIAVKVGGVAIATLGFASFPAFTVILEGVLFRERIRRNEALLVLLVSIGLLFSLLSLTNRAGSGRLPAVQAALWQNLVVGLCLLPFAAPGIEAVTPLDWLWIALLGVFCTGVAHSLFVAALAVIKARTAAVVFGMEPVYGIAVAWAVFAETPTLSMLAGGALIIFAIVLSSRMAGNEPARQHAAEGA